MIRKLRRWIVLLFAVLLPLVAAVRIFAQSDREKELEYRTICRSLSVNIEQNGRSQTVQPWRDESGVYYLVLPSYARHAELSFEGTGQYDRTVLLEGMPADAMRISGEAQGEQGYRMTVQNTGGRTLEEGQLKVLFSDRLPAVYVTTKTGNMDTIHASKDNKEKGTVTVYTQGGTVDYEGQLNFIKGRGNVTWQENKKPYNLSLEQAEPLLMMDASSEWALLAGAKDPSYLRNRLAFSLAKEMGLADTSDSAFVDLYCNGEYAGLYLLTEKVGAAKGEAFGQAASAQEYLLELEMQERLEAEPSAFQTAAGQGIVLKSQTDEAGRNAVKAQVQRFEDAVYAQNWEQISALADMDSFVKIYLAEEILQNHDAYISSQYIRLFEENGRFGPIYSGPVWDFDSCLTPKDGMFARTLTAAQPRADYPKYWIPYFTRITAFQELVKEQYGQIREAYLEEQIWQDIDHSERQLGKAVELDCLRWHNQDPAGWTKELDDMRNYLRQRLAFLDELWIAEEPFCTVHVEADGDTFTDMDYLVRPGEVCGDFPAHFTKQGFAFEGWYIQDTDIAFDTEQPIYEDLSIEAKWREEDRTVLSLLRSSGLLQARYLLLIGMLLTLAGLLVWDKRRHRR